MWADRVIGHYGIPFDKWVGEEEHDERSRRFAARTTAT
jgi:hypothetical protein